MISDNIHYYCYIKYTQVSRWIVCIHPSHSCIYSVTHSALWPSEALALLKAFIIPIIRDDWCSPLQQVSYACMDLIVNCCCHELPFVLTLMPLLCNQIGLFNWLIYTMNLIFYLSQVSCLCFSWSQCQLCPPPSSPHPRMPHPLDW